MIIDFHVHCFPDELAAKAMAVLSAECGINPFVNGTTGAIKESMSKGGIDLSVVLSIATRPQQASRITQWGASIQDGAIMAFGSIHPESRNWGEELTEIRNAGLPGIKFHPDYQGFYVDEKRLFPVYEKAEELGLIVIFHAGKDIGLPPPSHCTPDRLQRVVRAFPGCKFVAAHTGGYQYWDDVEKFLVGENIYMDTSFSLGWVDRSQFLRIVRNHGHEKFLFGSDSPWTDQKGELERIRSVGLLPEEERAILGGNAVKLLGLTCGNN